MSTNIEKDSSNSCIISGGNGGKKVKDSDTCRWADNTAEGLAEFAGESPEEKQNIYDNMMDKLTENED